MSNTVTAVSIMGVSGLAFVLADAVAGATVAKDLVSYFPVLVGAGGSLIWLGRKFSDQMTANRLLAEQQNTLRKNQIAIVDRLEEMHAMLTDITAHCNWCQEHNVKFHPKPKTSHHRLAVDLDTPTKPLP